MKTDISYNQSISYNQRFSLKHQFKVIPMQMPTNLFFLFALLVFLEVNKLTLKYMEILMSSNSQEIPGRKRRPERRVCTHI
jgi:hypothetical protein